MIRWRCSCSPVKASERFSTRKACLWGTDRTWSETWAKPWVGWVVEIIAQCGRHSWAARQLNHKLMGCGLLEHCTFRPISSFVRSARSTKRSSAKQQTSPPSLSRLWPAAGQPPSPRPLSASASVPGAGRRRSHDAGPRGATKGSRATTLCFPRRLKVTPWQCQPLQLRGAHVDH
jgi:hypothetical protein